MKPAGAESCKRAEKRSERLQMRQKPLSEKRERIVDDRQEGATTKPERDRWLKHAARRRVAFGRARGRGEPNGRPQRPFLPKR